ncbi:MAG: asparagine synthase (glutamine-hydrolyzing) [Sandaracinus sp.]
MCGIAGLIGSEPRQDVVRAMCDAIAHRGPDGHGIEVRRANGRVATLGHRRLSIVDLATGAQPMEDARRHAIVSFNGEIYDHVKTRARLEKEGVRFATQSDTEVIVAGFAAWGERIVPALHGMFAFCAFDERDGTVLLARDRFGIKPLYVAQLPGGGLAFASELSAMLAVPEIRKKISDAGLASYLFSDYAHPPHTLIEGVEKLAPGEQMLGRVGRAWERRSYLPSSEPDGSPPTPEELWATLGDAVQSQLMSDVPLGVFLSGGLDSSCVAALAAQRSKTRLQAFCIAFEDASFDESAHARRMSAYLGLEHVEEKLDAPTLLANVDRVLGHLDEPLGDHSIVPTDLLCRLASKHVKVALGGDGADELFGGYPTYRAHVLHARLLRPITPLFRGERARALIERIPASDGYQALDWKVKRFLGRWDDDVATRHLRWMSAVDVPALRDLMGARYRAPATLSEPVQGADPIAIASALDFRTYMPGSVLTKVDRASMTHGLEARPPFLDEKVVALARRVPSRDKVRGSTGKWLLRRASERALPRAILERGKHGFSVPLAAWLRGPLAPRLDAMLVDSPIWSVLDRPTAQAFARSHAARRGDHAKALWALLVLDVWSRRFGVSG